MTIRCENSEQDVQAVRSIQELAFGRRDEAGLVDALRSEGVILLSLLAEIGERPVGHVLFSRMWVETGDGRVAAVALAPVAVLPGYQRQGVAAQLIRHGLDRLRAQGERIVIVLGEPHYYERFGFAAERARRLRSPFPADAFMALELRPGALDRVQGRVVYPVAFGIE